MTTGIRSNEDGSKSYIQVGGTDVVTIGSQGIETGSLAPGSVTPTELSQKLTAYTAVAASGTAIDFTGIPSWAKRITVMFSGVSTNGASNPLLQLGSGSVQTSGYVGSAGNQSTSVTSSAYTTGVGINSNGASSILQGIAIFVNVGGNTWVGVITGGFSVSSCFYSGGTVTLSGTLDRLRLTTVNGTDTFDAGTINIMWE